MGSNPERWRQFVCNFPGTRGSVKKATPNYEMKNIIELTETNFESEVLHATGPVLVDFYAPWCGPCLMLAPLLEQFAAEFAGKVKFAKVNIDDAAALAGEYEIRSVPTLMVFRDGEPVDQVEGFYGPRPFKGWLEKAANLDIVA
jgi:thioredoxin 1